MLLTLLNKVNNIVSLLDTPDVSKSLLTEEVRYEGI